MANKVHLIDTVMIWVGTANKVHLVDTAMTIENGK